MPARTWKILSGKDVEKFSGNLNRYIRDGDMDRARRQIDRLCISAGSEGDAVFWEIVPVCLEVIYDIWTQGVDGDRLWSDLFETECTPAKWLDLYFKELSERPQDGKGDALESLLSWMEEQYAGDISLQMAAKRMGMDQSYFSRYFKKQTGKNFSDKLMEIRLRHCEEILQSSPSISLDELTVACGFHSKSYFCEVFRKWKGMTVTQYVGQKE